MKMLQVAILLLKLLDHLTNYQGKFHEVLTGGGGGLRHPKTSTPKSSQSEVSPDFGHLLLKMSENVDFLIPTYQEKRHRNIKLSGVTSSAEFSTGGRVPRPAAFDAHAVDVTQINSNKTDLQNLDALKLRYRYP